MIPGIEHGHLSLCRRSNLLRLLVLSRHKCIQDWVDVTGRAVRLWSGQGFEDMDVLVGQRKATSVEASNEKEAIVDLLFIGVGLDGIAKQGVFEKDSKGHSNVTKSWLG